MLIAASLLAANPANLGADARAIDAAGADWLHVDLFDAHFVPTLSFGPATAFAVRAYTQKPLDIHLMVDAPHAYIPQLAPLQAQAPHNVRMTIHLEACLNPVETLTAIKATGMAVGLALRLETPADAVLPYLNQLDQVLVMTVRGSFGGDPFQEGMCAKIAQLRHAIDVLPSEQRPLLAVDGGISPATAPLVQQAGATVLCAGSSLFKGADWAANVRAFHKN